MDEPTNDDEAAATPSTTPSPPSSASFFPKNDLVEFIQQESLSTKSQSDQVVVETYACTLWKGFFDMKHKLLEIHELDQVHAIDMGLQLVDNLFWIIYHYSSNVQLTLFLTERGRLLYTEFLYMSRTHKLMKELNTFPSIQDGFQFAIKKSIGSLTCCTEHSTNMLFQHISTYRSTFRRIFQVVNRKYLANAKAPPPTQPQAGAAPASSANAPTHPPPPSPLHNASPDTTRHPVTRGATTDADTPWTDDEVNLTLHALNRVLSFAVHRHPTLFEHCVYTRAYEHALSLTGYLLLLQLLSDVSDKHPDTIANEERVVRAVCEFIHANDTYTRDNTLVCLEKGHVVQHKWTLYRATVLQWAAGGSV